MSSVSLKNISKTYYCNEINNNSIKKYKTVDAIKKFNLEINDQEFIVLVGPSGSGKTTILMMIAGLEEISDGELYIDDKIVNNIAPKDRDVAMVFQSFALYPHMTVRENITFPLKNAKVPKNIINNKIKQISKILEITEYLDRKPKTLSSGQKQRVAIARAIIKEPKLLLMDEPLSNLDVKLRNQMRLEMIKLKKSIDTTFIYVTHDQIEAMSLGDRIVVMNEGMIQQIGTAEEVFNKPYNLFVASFIGTPQMNIFEGELIEQNDQYLILIDDYYFELPIEKNIRLKANNTKTRKVLVGIRPDDLKIESTGIKAKVEMVEMMGSSVYLHLSRKQNNNTVVLVLANADYTNLVNNTVNINCLSKNMHIFDMHTQVNLEY